MNSRLSCAVGVATMLFAANPALAADKVATIRVQGDEIRVPIPEGLCEPVGAYADLAQMTAAGDTQNITLLTLNDCADMAARKDVLSTWVHVKAPREFLAARITQEQLVKEMSALPVAEAAKAIRERVDNGKVGADISQVSGKDTKVDMTVQLVGVDSLGAYFAGVVTMQQEGQTFAAAAAAAMTSVKGHLLSYNFYSPGDTVAKVDANLARAKAETKRLLNANP